MRHGRDRLKLVEKTAMSITCRKEIMYRMAITALTLACAVVVTPAVAALRPPPPPNPLSRLLRRKCQFTFSESRRARISKKRYGFSRVYVSKKYVGGVFNTDMVVVRAPGMTSSLSEGARGNMRANNKNTLSFRVLAITSQGPTIRFTG